MPGLAAAGVPGFRSDRDVATGLGPSMLVDTPCIDSIRRTCRLQDLQRGLEIEALRTLEEFIEALAQVGAQ